MLRRHVVVVIAVLLWVSSPSPTAAAPGTAQAPAPVASVLTVAGDVRTPLTMTAADLMVMPRKRVEVKDEEGRTVTYDGVLVGEILTRAGTPSGADMRGAAVATYVVATANDGYQVVFSLAELDPGFTGSEIIVADTIDGKPLFAYQGPFRIVAPHDTRPARSIRMLERLEVVRLKK